MTADEILALHRDCAAAFSSSPADIRSCRLWAEVCAEVPFAAAPFIRRKVLELDSLPRNFGKAILGFFREWRSSRPVETQRACCPDCDPQHPGFFHWWGKINDRMYSGLARCLCNDDATLGGLRQMSKSQAEREGLIVMPRGYKGGPAEFEKERWFYGGAPSGNIGASAKRVMASPPPATVRPAHRDYIAEAEGWQ